MPITAASRRATLLLTALAATMSACSATIGERQLLIPVAAGALTPAAVAAAVPAYTLTRHGIAAADGVMLHAVLLRQPGARATVLYFGGNAYAIGRQGTATARAFAPLGVDLMLVDHRGYGQSGGTPTFDALERDGLAAFDYLAKLAGPARIVVHGKSLGSFTAGHVAANRPAAGVALESSVTTAEDWMRSRAPAGVAIKLDAALRGRGNSANVARIEEPLLLLAGGRDALTPPALSRELYRQSPLGANRKFLTIVEDADHQDVLSKPDAASAYRAFLASLRP